MNNIEDYKPIIDTTLIDDEVIELWYGSKFAIIIIRSIEGLIIENENVKLYYCKNDNPIFCYNLLTKNITIDLKHYPFNNIKDHIKYSGIYLNIFKQQFSYEINNVLFSFVMKY